LAISLRYLAAVAFGLAAPAGAVAPAPVQDIPVALMVEFSTGQVLFERDANRRFMPASVTKVMTAYCAFELIDSGRLRQDSRFTVDPDTFKEWSGKGSTMFLPLGAHPTVQELLMGTTTISANDGAIMLAKGVDGSVPKWAGRMNRTARALGMTDSHFATPNGWMDGGATFVTANDLATLGRAMISRHPGLYHQYFGHRSYAYNGIAMANHDPITGAVEGADGIKSGFTNQAGYNFLGSAARGGRRLVMVVAGVESGAKRKQIAREFIEWGFSSFHRQRLFDRDDVIATAMVQDGAASEVALMPTGAIAVSTPQPNTPLTLELVYDGPVRAPISKGQQIAELRITPKGMTPFSVPLRAAEAVPQASFARRVINGLLDIFG